MLKFAGAYHGHVDGLLAEAGSGLATQGIPSSPGVLEAATSATVIVPWNDAEALVEATERYELAAILAEPIAANMGVVPPEPGFLELLRERADKTGALLVFDEVITGFRVARGGAQELYGTTPDLSILGKIIGGGVPAAAYGGPPLLMERIAPAGDVYQAGTLSGNPLAIAAGLATLELLDARAYSRLAQTTEQLAQGLRDAAARAGVPLQVQTAPGLLTPFFSDRPGSQLRRRRRLRSRCLRRVVPGAAVARRLSAPVAVRGLVPVGRPHAEGRRADRRGGEAGVRRDALAMSATASLRAALREQGGALAEAAEQSGRGPRGGAWRAQAGGIRAAGRQTARPSTSCCSR